MEGKLKVYRVDELVDFAKKIGADECVIESITSETSRSWAFYWRGLKATFSKAGIKFAMAVEVFVPNLEEYIGYIHPNDCTGRHMAKKRCAIETLEKGGIFVLS